MNKLISVMVVVLLVIITVSTLGCGTGARVKVDDESEALSRQFGGYTNTDFGVGCSSGFDRMDLAISIFNAMADFDNPANGGYAGKHLDNIEEWKAYLKTELLKIKDRNVNVYHIDHDIFNKQFDSFYNIQTEE